MVRVVFGIPDLDGRGFKVGIVTSELVSRTRDWLGGRFPGLSNAPLLDAHVCQYENTHTGDFLIDRHPAWNNVWIVGGGSGHGFEHGPAVGRHVAASVEGTATLEPRFALSAKQADASRAIY